VGAVAARPLAASCPAAGVGSQLPAGAWFITEVRWLYKICANKKIGESEGKKAHHHGHHPEVQSLPEEKIRRRKMAEIPAAHLKRIPE